jgi:hypothetical protein
MTIAGPLSHLSRHRCSVCGGAMTVHDEVRGGTCADPRCRRAAVLAAMARREPAEPEARAALARSTIVPTLGVADAGSVVIAFVPSGPDRVTPLPRRRRLAFRRHLAAVVRAALEPGVEEAGSASDDPPGTSEPGEETALARAGCSTCRGFCCQLGASHHAFLDVATIRRVVAARPDQQVADALVAEYLALVPAESGEHSCVFHGAAGCTVPRPMRAAICNDFHCDALRALEQRHEREPGGSGTLVVARSGSDLKRWRHVDHDGSTMLRGEPRPPVEG